MSKISKKDIFGLMAVISDAIGTLDHPKNYFAPEFGSNKE
jgi:hypothetical protein